MVFLSAAAHPAAFTDQQTEAFKALQVNLKRPRAMLEMFAAGTLKPTLVEQLDGSWMECCDTELKPSRIVSSP